MLKSSKQLVVVISAAEGYPTNLPLKNKLCDKWGFYVPRKIVL